MDNLREKVMKGLSICSGDDPDCQNCPYYGEYGDGFGCETIMQRDALSLLKAQEPGWISVKDRLPENVANRVIVWVKDAEIYGHIGFGHYEKYKGQEIWFNLINNEAFEIRGQTVTHWLQLPEPPKEE